MGEKQPGASNESFNLEQAIISKITTLKKQLNALNIGQVEKLPIDKKRELVDLLNKVNLLINDAQK